MGNLEYTNLRVFFFYDIILYITILTYISLKKIIIQILNINTISLKMALKLRKSETINLYT